MGIQRRAVALAVLGFNAACHEPASPPTALAASGFSLSGETACPIGPAAFTVTDEASLRAALGAARSGDVIALDGFVGVTTDVIIATDDLTLTCATPGSGIFPQAGAPVEWLVQVRASGVTVDRLVLDGSSLSGGPYIAGTNVVSEFIADRVRLTRNTVRCGRGECAFLAGTRGAIVTDNHFEAAGSGTGVHLQVGGDARQIDGSRVERNTIVATAPSGAPVFGGIRLRDGSDVIVAGNVVRGPWSNAIATTDLTASRFENNRVEGATGFGLWLGAGASFVPVAMTKNLFRANEAAGAGGAGILASVACGNTFVGNNLEGNAGDVGAIFDAMTGANTFAGNRNVVLDNGDFDCDGDGATDPNVITGPGLARNGVPFAPPAAGTSGNGRIR